VDPVGLHPSLSEFKKKKLKKPRWLRQYATNRKITVSIPDEVIGFFN
jgi:hypothetical protein